MSEERAAWKSVLGALGASLVHCMAAVVVMLVLIGGIPRFIKVFEDYDAELPAATILIINLSELAVNYWYTFLIPLALDCLLLIGLSLAPPKVRWLARAWSGLVLTFAFLLLAFALLAVSLPFERIGISLPNDVDPERSTANAIDPLATPPWPAPDSLTDAEN
jgi:hypothetical protein